MKTPKDLKSKPYQALLSVKCSDTHLEEENDRERHIGDKVVEEQALDTNTTIMLDTPKNDDYEHSKYLERNLLVEDAQYANNRDADIVELDDTNTSNTKRPNRFLQSFLTKAKRAKERINKNLQATVEAVRLRTNQAVKRVSIYRAYTIQKPGNQPGRFDDKSFKKEVKSLAKKNAFNPKEAENLSHQGDLPDHQLGGLSREQTITSKVQIGSSRGL